jgi:hypothetical protein
MLTLGIYSTRSFFCTLFGIEGRNTRTAERRLQGERFVIAHLTLRFCRLLPWPLQASGSKRHERNITV